MVEPYKIRTRNQTRRAYNSLLQKATKMWSGNYGVYRATMSDKDYKTIERIIHKNLKELGERR